VEGEELIKDRKLDMIMKNDYNDVKFLRKMTT